MAEISTEAWVIRRGQRKSGSGTLHRQEITFSLPQQGEVLVEPLFGCWEANMTHALLRDPVDVCRLRREPYVVLGNAGVVRVLDGGQGTDSVSPGDYCFLMPAATSDRRGFTDRVYGYDQPDSIGLLAKKTKVPAANLVPIPAEYPASLTQCAALPVRFCTAWSNWKVALRCWRSQQGERAVPPFVCAWGGGVAFAELLLAQHLGARVAMLTSSPERASLLKSYGIHPIDRSEFQDLAFDGNLFQEDRSYRAQYLKCESRFMEHLHMFSGGEGISIFIDNIGGPVVRATLRALDRQGILTTTGWKHGRLVGHDRAVECNRRHIHVHTHGVNLAEIEDSLRYVQSDNWIPPAESKVYSWDEIPHLADAYASGIVRSYFPTYQVNAI